MALGLPVIIEGLAQAQRKFREAPERVGEPVRVYLESATRLIKTSAQEFTPVDTGRLRSSWRTEVQMLPLLEARVYTPVRYAPFVEVGRRPGTYPPLDAMQPWARRHGFPAGRAGAFLVARAIARKGIKGKRMLQRAVRVTNMARRALLNKLGRDIEAAMRRP